MSAPRKVTTDFTLPLNRQMADTGRDFCAVRKFGFLNVGLCFESWTVNIIIFYINLSFVVAIWQQSELGCDNILKMFLTLVLCSRITPVS